MTRPPDYAQSLAPRGVSRSEAAAYLGIGTTLFDALVRNNLMPKPKAIFSRRVWDVRELDKAFAELPEADDPVQAKGAEGANPYDDLHV
jgi:hypothetical protein